MPAPKRDPAVSPPPRAEDRPRLEDLHGMGKAKIWGLNVARDLAEYINKKISWRHMDRGCLLHGGPGTGKTTFAKALATSCGVTLIATSYANWQRYREGHLGNVLSAIREDFRKAIERAPSILFIDEIDVIPSRERAGIRNRDWWDPIVGALLQELDGITGREGVIVIAACNYPERVDPALVRAGRLDNRIEIEKPTVEDLAGILRFYLADDLRDADLGALALCASGMTGADMEKLVRDARRIARSADRRLEMGDIFAVLEDAADRIPEDCLETVAVHEAGHAAAAILLAVSNNVTTSLVRRGTITASTHFDPRVEAITRKVVDNRMAVALAGRAAEEVILGEVSAGSGGGQGSDLAIATALAIRSAASWGLGLSCSENLLHSEGPPEQILALRPELAQQVHAMLQAAYNRAVALVEAHRGAIGAIAVALVERRALTHEEIAAFLSAPAGDAARSVKRRRRRSRG
ncbi:MAG: AAA family ATPase [Hyphomicrobiaceae bacterium]|nr:MAG: AAA family ATPase [Hyphomicrobiaceae bacterium]